MSLLFYGHLQSKINVIIFIIRYNSYVLTVTVITAPY